SLEVRIHFYDLAVIRANLSHWRTIRIIFSRIFYLDHSSISSWLQYISVRISFLPKPYFFVIIDYINGMPNKPPVSLVSIGSRCKSDQFVFITIKVYPSFPSPSVMVIQYQSVKRKLKSFIL